MSFELLSKTKYCIAIQCEKILWLRKYKREYSHDVYNHILLENGLLVEKVAKGLFGKYDAVKTEFNLSSMIDNTKKLLQYKFNVITEASFNYNNNFCSVDILKNATDGVEIYEIKGSTEILDIYLDDIAYQYYVISNYGLNVTKACIIYINKDYVHGKTLDPHRLFIIEDVTKIVKSKKYEIGDNIEFFRNYMQTHDEFNEPVTDIGLKCSNPYDCIFWEYCTDSLPKPNVFDLTDMPKSRQLELYQEGKISFEVLRHEDLNPRILEQINFEINEKEAKIDKEAIQDILDSLDYPLYFLDFQTFRLAIPELEKTKPFQHLAFQYSLHILKEEGKPLEHKGYLVERDDTDYLRTFAEKLIQDIPENASVIVYNKKFKQDIIMDIAEIYPDLKDELLQINKNMIDIMEVFRKRYYYTKQMKGSYSIKDVLPVLYPNNQELTYDNLNIRSNKFASLMFLRLKIKHVENPDKTRQDLVDYCEHNTFFLFKIWEKLNEIVKEYNDAFDGEQSIEKRMGII